MSYRRILEHSIRITSKETCTSSYACRLALRFALVIIFSGPFAPKFMADALVTSEKVGDGLLAELRLERMNERVGAMSVEGAVGINVRPELSGGTNPHREYLISAVYLALFAGRHGNHALYTIF